MITLILFPSSIMYIGVYSILYVSNLGQGDGILLGQKTIKGKRHREHDGHHLLETM